MKGLASKLLDRGYKRALFVLLAALLGIALGVLAFRLYARLPRGPSGSWQQLPQPPAELTGLVTATPMSALMTGEIYATTADGTLYAYVCQGDGCAWAGRDALPPPPDEDSYWSGHCAGGNDLPEGLADTPTLPGRVVDSYGRRYCGPDYSNDLYVILLDDGTVWQWNRFWSGMGEFYGRIIGTACGGCGGLILGLVVGIVVIIVAARRSRSTP
jgi:hypothetical protein